MLPQLAAATLPAPPPQAVELRVQPIACVAIVPLLDSPPREPETPPF
jgi:hypothetical protein